MIEYNDTLASKTRRKQDRKDLEEVGQQLMALKTPQRARLPLTVPLEKALDEGRRITSLEARRRHAVFVARLVDEADTEALLSALAALTDPTRQQRLQQWTDRIVECTTAKEAEPVIQQVLDAYPQGDRQVLRNQARNVLKARPADPVNADKNARDRLKRERKRFLGLLNELEKSAPLY